MTQRRETLRIANCSGFYGDRLSAAREMVEGGPIDVLTGDYLAELTMLLLWKARQRDPEAGYALSFLAQMGDVLGTCLDRGIRIVVNAGGLNPAGLAAKLRELAALAGLNPSVAHLEGDDLLDRLPGLQREGHPFTHLATGLPLADAGVRPLTANAYLGAWGITEALRAGADVVICGRVTDASLVVGPAAWAFDWATDDWDRLAGAVTAGHIIECGAQATGGNYSFFTEIERPVRPGFPIAELRPDGSSVITKHEGTAGAVTVDTVTAQLLYEIDRPAYLNPDVVTRFDTVTLEQEGTDRVLVTGARGEPAPDTLKVCLNHHGGYRNSATFVLAGPDIEAKARFAGHPCSTRPAARPASGRTTSAPSPPPPAPGSPSPSRTPTRTRSAAPCSAPSSERACPPRPVCTWSTSRPGPPSTACTGRPSCPPPSSTPRSCSRTAPASPCRARPPRRHASPRSPRPRPAGRPRAPPCAPRWACSSAPAPATRAATPTSASGPVTTPPTPGCATGSTSNGCARCCRRPRNSPSAATSCPTCAP